MDITRLCLISLTFWEKRSWLKWEYWFSWDAVLRVRLTGGISYRDVSCVVYRYASCVYFKMSSNQGHIPLPMARSVMILRKQGNWAWMRMLLLEWWRSSKRSHDTWNLTRSSLQSTFDWRHFSFLGAVWLIDRGPSVWSSEDTLESLMIRYEIPLCHPYSFNPRDSSSWSLDVLILICRHWFST